MFVLVKSSPSWFVNVWCIFASESLVSLVSVQNKKGKTSMMRQEEERRELPVDPTEVAGRAGPKPPGARGPCPPPWGPLTLYPDC